MRVPVIPKFILPIVEKRDKAPELSGLTLPLSYLNDLNTLMDFPHCHFCESQNASEHLWSRLYFP